MNKKAYEQTNHLGNVLVTVSDARQVLNSGTTVTGYSAIVKSANDYSAFGAPIVGRTYTSSSYRYGFKGIEKSPDECAGAYSADYREYDSRLARWLSRDPIVKEWESPYAGFSNNPILFKDPSGLDPTNEGTDPNGLKSEGTTTVDNAQQITVQYNEDGTHTIEEVVYRRVMVVTKDGESARDITYTETSSTTTVTMDANGNVVSYSSSTTTTKSYGREFKDPCGGNVTYVSQGSDPSSYEEVKSWGDIAVSSLAMRGSAELKNYVQAVGDYVKDPTKPYKSPILAMANYDQSFFNYELMVVGIGAAFIPGMTVKENAALAVVLAGVGVLNDALVESSVHKKVAVYRTGYGSSGAAVGTQNPTANPEWWKEGAYPCYIGGQNYTGN